MPNPVIFFMALYLKDRLDKRVAEQQNQQMTCVPSEDSDQPGHLPSLIRVFAVHFMGSEAPNFL